MSPEITPYDYQEECLGVLQKVRKRKERALVVMASGLGKTVVTAFDIRSHITKHDGRILFLCHQNDILDQAYETFQEVLGEEFSFGYLDGRQKEFEPVDVLFGSFQTMHNWREEFKPRAFDYIVVDESHHSPAETYLPTLKYFQPRFLLGITATPDRTDLQDIREIYGDEIYSLPLEDGLAQGLLAPVDYRLLTDELQNLKILDTPIGRLSIKKLNRDLFIPKRDKEIARILKEKLSQVKDPRVMIFVPSIAYCNRLARILPGSAPIHSEMQLGKQAETLRAFRAREINTVITIDKFNEGIDVPDANVIVFLRSTASRTIFFQQLGRGLRKTRGKRRVLVLDFVANCERLEMVHGLWTAVEEKKRKIKRSLPKIEEPLIVDIGKFEFDETARNVLDVIRGIRVGYTKEILINQLRELAQELGRTPTKADISQAARLGKSATYPTYRKYFGSFEIALEKANLIPRARIQFRKQLRMTTEQLVKELKALGEKFGRAPTKVEVDEASKQGKCASSGTYRRRFGSFSTAIRATGFTPRLRGQWLGPQELRTKRDDVRSDEKLQDDLRALAEELGRTPTFSDVEKASKQGKCAHTRTYHRRFGSYTNACKLAGLKPNKSGGQPKKKKGKSDTN